MLGIEHLDQHVPLRLIPLVFLRHQQHRPQSVLTVDHSKGVSLFSLR